MIVEIPIIGQAYPSICIVETRLLRLRSDSWAMATLLKNFCIRVRPSSSVTKFERLVRSAEKMLVFPISTFVSGSWGVVELSSLQGCVERTLQECVERVVNLSTRVCRKGVFLEKRTPFYKGV